MNILNITKIFLLIALLAAPLTTHANMDMTPIKGSDELEAMKKLAGSWSGTDASKGEGEESHPVKAEYTVVSNGSAVMEKIFSGTPQEMVTMYYDKNGALAMTHYCSVGNQPLMDLIATEGNTYIFSLSRQSDIDVASEPHMHDLTISMNEDQTVTQHWTFYQNGTKQGVHSFTFKRDQ